MSNWTCPIHGTAKFVPPGVVKQGPKAGQPYDGFFCCTERDCKQRPPRNAPATQSVSPPRQNPQPTPPRAVAPNWDKIAEGKCRSLALCAWVQSGRELDQFWAHERDFVTYMMTGTPPGFDERVGESWEPTDSDLKF